MKFNRLIISMFVVILLAFAGFSYPGEKIELNGTEYFDPMGLMGPPVGTFISPGTVKCPGYEPTGNPAQPCPDGSRIHVRDSVWMSKFVSEDEQFDGWFTIEANANLAPDFTGPQWGTFRLEFDEGGVMTGTWQGVRVIENGVWVSPLHVTGKIVGGDFDGARYVGSDRIVGPFPLPIAYIGTVEGTLVRVRNSADQ